MNLNESQHLADKCLAVFLGTMILCVLVVAVAIAKPKLQWPIVDWPETETRSDFDLYDGYEPDVWGQDYMGHWE